MFGNEDPFADFGKFFEDVEETVVGGEDEEKAKEELVQALSKFYAAVGQHDKSPIAKVKEVLDMPKWKGKEMKMFRNLQKKYADPQYNAHVAALEKAFNNYAKSSGGSGGGGGFGDFG